MSAASGRVWEAAAAAPEQTAASARSQGKPSLNKRVVMGRFASTVAYYESARPPYPEQFFAEAAAELGFDRSQRLLDVGTGPGILAIGFARYCGEVAGVDPEPAMIEAAREAAARAGVALELIEGRFEDMPDSVGAFDVVTIGRALHWLDPEPTRRRLERVVARHGRILVCHASSVKDGRNAWLATFNAIRQRWSGERARHDYNAVLAGGRFVSREAIRVEATQSLPVERLADRVLSMSTSSPERLGDDAPEMRRALREALAPFAAGGVLEEIIEAQAEVFEDSANEPDAGSAAR
jgi:SAM-dependent methyltransferase